MPKLNLATAAQIKHSSGTIQKLKGSGFSWELSTPATRVLVVFAGQKNARATQTTGSDVPVDLDVTDSNIRIWDAAGASFVTYNPGTNSDLTESGATTPQPWGPETAFIAEFKTANPGVALDIVKFTGEGPLRVDGGINDWNPGTAGEYFEDLETEVNAAKANILANLGATVEVAAFFWSHGEADANNTVISEAYYTGLDTLFTDVQSRIGNTDTLLVYDALQPSSTLVQSYNIMARQGSFALDPEPDTRIVATDVTGYTTTGTDYEYDVAGIRKLGEDYYSAYAGTLVNQMRYNTEASSTDLAMTNNNRTATATAGGVKFGYANIALSNNTKNYLEIDITAFIGPGLPVIGFGRITGPTSFWGQSTQTIGWLPDGRIFRGNSNVATVDTYATGDTVGICFDGTTGEFWFAVNNTFTGDPAAGTGASTTLTSAVGVPSRVQLVGINTVVVGDSFTFRDTAAYTPPTGYTFINNY